MRFIIPFLLTLFSISTLVGQQHHKCGYDFYKNHLVEQHPELRNRIDAPFTQARKNAALRSDEVYTINVVVHNVYQNEDQIKTDEEIQAVIDTLTENFRNQNFNKGELRPEFLDLSADSYIEFNLAQIIKVETTALFELDLFAGNLPDNVKISEDGGSDAVNPEQFLNIWICHIEGGSLLGYAYPPADLVNWPADSEAPEQRLDGVVIHEEVFRKEGTYTVPDGPMIEVRGRTVVHEVGHYLGLRHIWGDGLLSIFGIADCDADDGVEDTPNQGLQSQFLCDETQNTCEDEVDDLLDMYENYMDYSSELCQSTFTHGQVAIMRSVIENERSGLIQPLKVNDINADQWKIFPNPAEAFLHLDLGTLEMNRLEIWNMSGQKLTTLNPSNHQKVDIGHLPKGIYTMRLVNGTSSTSKRFIKM